MWFFIAPVNRWALGVIIALSMLFLLFDFGTISPFSVSTDNFLTLHTALEFFSVVTAIMVFALGWNAYQRNRSGNYILLACGFLAVALLDFAHTMTGAGMPGIVAGNSAEKSMDFTLASNFMPALTLLAVSLMPWRPFASKWTAALLLAIALGLAAAIYGIALFTPESVINFFSSDHDLLSFKLGTKYALFVVYLISAFLFLHRAKSQSGSNLAWLATAALTLGLAKLFFTIQPGNHFFVLLSHLYTVIGFGIVYKTIFSESIREPYERLREERDLTFSLFNCLPSLTFMVDQKGNFLQWNQRLEEVSGYNHEEISRMSPLDFITVIEHPQLIEMIENTFKKGSTQGEVTLLTKHGSHIPYYFKGRIITVSGKPCLIGTGTDISRHKQDESALRSARDELELRVNERTAALAATNVELKQEISERMHAEHRLSEVLDLNQKMISESPVGIAAYKSTGECMLVNEAIARILNTTTDRLLAQNFLQSPSWQSDGLLTIAQDTLDSGKPHFGEFHLIINDGINDGIEGGKDKWLDCSCNVFMSGGERHLLVMLHDISERKHAELGLVQAKEQAERASSAKSAFLSRMSHELRTPMNAILGFGQLLELQKLEPDQHQYMAEIMGAGYRLLDLINELLDLTKIESGRMSTAIEAVDISSIVNNTLRQMDPLLKTSGLSLSYQKEGFAGKWVMTDPMRLRQILGSLISNAIKYTQAGGNITIACQVLDENLLRVSVTDTGIGIPYESQKNLFKPFEKIDNGIGESEGAKIGLALSQKFAQMMGTSLGMNSIPGKGSTFWIDLQLTSHSNIGNDSVSENAPLPQSKSSKRFYILYIEDNSTNVRLLQHLFSSHPDILLITAISGEAGLQLAKDYQPDLILMDIRLPGMNGYETMAQVKSDPITKDIPIIAISSDATSLAKYRTLATGFERHLTKPIQIQELLDAINEIMSRPSQDESQV